MAVDVLDILGYALLMGTLCMWVAPQLASNPDALKNMSQMLKSMPPDQRRAGKHGRAREQPRAKRFEEGSAWVRFGLVARENIPALLASDWSIVRIYRRQLGRPRNRSSTGRRQLEGSAENAFGCEAGRLSSEPGLQRTERRGTGCEQIAAMAKNAPGMEGMPELTPEV
eukprot:9294002-Pyramimonas_sp.AAC.1